MTAYLLLLALARPDLKWVDGYEKALLEAQTSGETIAMLIVDAKDDLCKKAEKDAEASQAIQEALKAMIVCKCKKSPDIEKLMKLHHLNVTPCWVFLDRDEKIRGRIDGYSSTEETAKKIGRISTLISQWDPWHAALKANPNDIEAAANIAEASALREDLTKSKRMLDQAEKTGPEPGKLAAAYIALGDAYELQNKSQEAFTSFVKASQTSDVHLKSYAMLSCAHSKRKMGKKGEARKILAELLKVDGISDQTKNLAELMIKD